MRFGVRRSALWPDRLVKPPLGTVEIDHTHPLAKGIRALFIMNEGGGMAVDLFRGLHAEPVNGAMWGGEALYLQSALTQYFRIASPTPALNLPRPFTISASCRPLSFGALRNVVYRDAAPAGPHFGIHTRVDGTWHGQSNDGAAFVDVSSPTVLTLNVPATLAYTVDASGNGLTYTNGLADGGSATGINPTGVNETPVDFGVDLGNARYWNGLVYWCAIHTVALTASEVQWLHLEPYSMLRPIVRRRWFAPSPDQYTWLRHRV